MFHYFNENVKLKSIDTKNHQMKREKYANTVVDYRNKVKRHLKAKDPAQMSSSLRDGYDFGTHVNEFAVKKNPLRVVNTHLQMAA